MYDIQFWRLQQIEGIRGYSYLDDTNPSSFVISKSIKFVKVGCVTFWYRKHSWIVLTKFVRWFSQSIPLKLKSPTIKRRGLAILEALISVCSMTAVASIFSAISLLGLRYTQPHKMFVLLANFISTQIWSLCEVCVHIFDNSFILFSLLSFFHQDVSQKKAWIKDVT